MQSSFIVLAFFAVSLAGLGGAVVGWVGATTVALLTRWEVVRHAAVRAHLCSG